MFKASMKLATREIVREIDRASIEEYGIAGLILMEMPGGRWPKSVFVGSAFSILARFSLWVFGVF
jgi:hypothetical protein